MKNNKRTRAKKKVKRRIRPQGVLVLLCLVVGLFFLARSLVKIDVASITVTGNNFVRDSEIIKSAGLNDSVSFLGLDSKSVCEKIESDALIDSCQIKRKLDFSIEIIVEESSPLFYYASNNTIVLSNGNEVNGTNLYGLATLVNYVPEDILHEFSTRLAEIDSDIIRSISEIEYSPTTSENGTYIDKERFVFDMNDGNTVIINNRKMSVFNHYKKIYASIDKLGVYNFDCDFDNYLFTEYGSEGSE